MRIYSKWLTNLLAASVLFIALLFVYSFTDKSLEKIDLYVEVLTHENDSYQVFYDTGNGFNENESIRLEVKKSEMFQKLKFAIPSEVKAIRIDPGEKSGVQELKKISFKANFQSLIWDESKIIAISPRLINVTIEPAVSKNNGIKLTTISDDPQLIFSEMGPDLDKLHNSLLRDAFYYFIFFLISGTLFILMQIKKMKDLIVIQVTFSAIFICILAAPIFGSFILDESRTNVENRTLTPNPFLHLKELSFEQFTGQFDNFINDNFIFRDQFIRWNNNFKVKWLGVSPVEDVLIGKEGWLMYNGPGVIQDYQGLQTFSEHELQLIRENLEERKRWLEAQGIAFYMLVVPEKSTIYPEYLPDYIRKTHNATRLDQLLVYINSNTDIKIIDLRPTLLEKKTEGQLYRKKDSHWNQLGAFFGYEKLITELSKDFTGISSLSLHDFESSSVKYPEDLSNMLWVNDENLNDQLILKPISSAKVEDYILEVYPNKDNTIITTAPGLPEDAYKLLMFRDSFATDMIPFLSRSFRTSIYIWDQNFDKNIILEEKPNIVVHEFVERFLPKLILLSSEKQ